MKIYEALKEMIENGKTILKDNTSYRLSKVDWQKEKLLLGKEKHSSQGWKLESALWIYTADFESDDWEVVEEVKDETN